MRPATQVAGLPLLALALVGCGGGAADGASGSNIAQSSMALTAAPGGDPGVAAGTLDVEGVAAPDGTLSLGDLLLSVDSNLVLLTAAGSMALSGGSVPATSYVVDPTLNDDLVAQGASFGQIDAVFAGNSPASLGGSSQEIPAAALVPGGAKGLVLGATVLPVTVDIIAAHEENGVRSYKVFEITFDGPQ